MEGVGLVAVMIAGVAIFVMGSIALSGPPLGFDTRAIRIWNGLSIGSAFVLLHVTNFLPQILGAGPVAKPLEFAFVLLLATLFVYNAVLEVLSWFSR